MFFGSLFFAVTSAPVSNILFPIGRIMGERLMYIPSAGYTIVVILVLEHLHSACRARRIAPAPVYDIAPTVLYLMGLSVARDMPDKVLMDALVSDYVESFAISYVEAYGTKSEGECEEGIAFASSRDREIYERLRALG